MQQAPDFGYKYHSQGILDTLGTLKTDFGKEKTQADAEWVKTQTTFNDAVAAYNAKILSNGNAIDGLNTDITTLEGDIAQAREDLVNAKLSLTDDQTYLRDLTTRCESRAKDWDQRSKLRADEIS